MGRPGRFSPEIRERAVRMVRKHAAEHPSQWAAMEAIAPTLGCTSETPRRGVRQAGRNAGERPGLTTVSAIGHCLRGREIYCVEVQGCGGLR